MSLVAATISLLTHWAMGSLTLLILWNICDYIRSKPEILKTLLDGATLHMFQYATLAVSFCMLTNLTFELSKTSEFWVQTSGWFLLAALHLSYLQLTVCAIVKFCLVFHVDLPEDWQDETIHWSVRINLLVIETLVMFGHWYGFGYNQLVFSTQNESNFVGPILAVLALGSQFVSRIIIYFKVRTQNLEEGSSEIIKTKTFVLVVILLIPYRILGIFIPFDTRMILFITQFLLLSFNVGTLYFSPNLCHFCQKKYNLCDLNAKSLKAIVRYLWTRIIQRIRYVLTFGNRFCNNSVEPMIELVNV